MPGKAAKTSRRRVRYPRGIESKIEQIIYDYVYENFGRSEAESPSWYIPNLAKHIAASLAAPAYKPLHEIQYEED